MSLGAATSPAERVRSLAPRIALWLRDHSEGGATSRGGRAVLRRMNPASVPPAQFWRIVDRFDIERHEDAFWHAVIPMMVDHAHGRASPGAALAESGVSGPRIERWLRLDRTRAQLEARRVFRRCERPLDWARLASLLWFWSETERRHLARDFFLSPEQRVDRDETSGTKEDSR